MNEGLIDIESLHEINFCLSNNIKNNIENIQYNSINVNTKYFNTEKELYDFFKSNQLSLLYEPEILQLHLYIVVT
jgi:hypothetical protein